MRKVPFSGFAWDNANYSKCQEHGVSVVEVEHVLTHAATLIVPDLKNSRAEQRFLASGRTQEGRYVFVVFTPRQTGGGILMRPISARYMHRKEIRKYEQEIARLQNR
jgi:uncharacterized DUF497 family protein